MSGDDRVLLADVKILTFTRGKSTTHRRVNAVKQLICQDNGSIGCPNKKEYLFESATCINEGIGENMMPSWSCTASSLPADTELGSVNVSCEGYTYRDDPYVLAGSCAMEYTLTAPTPHGPFVAFLLAFVGLFACCVCGKNAKKKPRGGAPPAYHEVSTLGTAGHTPTAPLAAGLPTAHAVHVDDLEKNNTKSSLGKAGAVATAHPVGSTASAAAATGGGAKTSGKTSLAAGAAAGAAVTAAAAAGVAALAGHNKNSKPEDHSLPKGWESKVDPATGKTFYLNHDTRETTWADPRKPSEQQHLLGGNNTHTGGNWWNPMSMGNRMRPAPIRGGLSAWQNSGHAAEHGESSTYQGATTSGRGGSETGHPSTTHGGTTGRGDDHTSTAHGGTSGRDGGGGWGGLFGGGGGGGGGHSSTAHGGTTGRGGSGGGWGGFGGGGGGHSSTAHGGSSGR